MVLHRAPSIYFINQLIKLVSSRISSSGDNLKVNLCSVALATEQGCSDDWWESRNRL